MAVKRKRSRSRPKAQPSRARAGKAARAKPAARDPIEDLVVASAQTLSLPIDPAWTPAIKFNLALILRLAGSFADFPLPDDAEPAPVFVA